jgi:hypothetical protein
MIGFGIGRKPENLSEDWPGTSLTQGLTWMLRTFTDI